MMPAIVRRVSGLVRYVRLTPFDDSTVEGRSSERYRRVALSSIADAAAKICGLCLMLFSVAVTIPYLGSERFGVWVTISSFTALLSFLDLGMGNALINRVAAAAAGPSDDTVGKVASGGIAVLLVLGLITGSILGVAAASVRWGSILNLHSATQIEEARSGSMLLAALFGMNVVATGLRSVFIGLQRAYEAHIVTAIGYCGAIIALWFASRAHAPIPVLLLSSFGLQVAAATLLAVLAFRRGLLFWPRIDALTSEAAQLVGDGGLFFLLQIGAMIGWGCDSIMIAHALGPAQVADFNITQRLFQVVALPLAMITAPLWAAYADARIRDERDFMGRTLKRSLQLVFTAGSIGVAIVLIGGPSFTEWWTSHAISVAGNLLLVFGLWTLVQGLGSALGVFLNGSGIIKPQLVAVSFFVLIGLPLKWYFLKNYGLVMFVIASMTAYLATHLSVYSVVYARYASQRSGRTASGSYNITGEYR